MHKTGDLVRHLSDGRLEYLGRNDLQVNIHGFRVEIGEVRAALSSYHGVTECAVIAKKIQDLSHSAQAKYLIAYFVSDEASVDEGDLKAFLSKRLPYYMVPATIVRVKGRLPVTINGKLDTRALPDVDFSLRKGAYAAPRNEIETQLCRVWTSLLRVDEIGIDDDFFRLGGDSILSLQLVADTRSELSLNITVKDVFDHKTIRNICDDALSKEDRQNQLKEWRAEQGMLIGEVPMLLIQQWFFAKPLKHRNHWNQSFFVRTPPLDVARLEAALEKLVDHHDAFHLRFKIESEEYVQSYEACREKIKLNTLDVKSLPNERSLHDVVTQWQSSFHLDNGPTFAFGYLYGYGDGSAKVWIAMHHLIVDTVSWRILIRDLRSLYEGADLERKGSSYRQWAQAIQTFPSSEAERLYWERIAEEVDLDDRAMPAPSAQALKTRFALSADQTRAILRNCHRAYDTRINELLLTALACALQGVFQKRTNCVTLEGHGRETLDLFLNISRTVGWFTTMYPFTLPCVDDLGTGIVSIKERLREVPNNGIGHGAIFGYVEKPLPRVSFNYLGQFEDGESATGSWGLADGTGECGLDRSPDDLDADNAVLDVTGLCHKGRMVFDLSSRLGPAQTEKFLSVFTTKLEQVIEHTLNVVHPCDGIAECKRMTTAVDDFVPFFEFRNEPRKGPLLFLFPPGEGGAESYFSNIVRRLDHSQLVVFNNYYLQHNDRRTFEDLAAYYIYHVRQIQPHGPYHLLGWSFGGVLSLEISRQLVGAGERIASLMLIDSYFNVRKASADIGLPGEEGIIDRIHYLYSPSKADLPQLTAHTDNIVLFKAPRMNEMHRSDQQARLYAYYMNSEYNLLDELVDRGSIQLVPLSGDSHFSWVKNEAQLENMCSVILSLLR